MSTTTTTRRRSKPTHAGARSAPRATTRRAAGGDDRPPGWALRTANQIMLWCGLDHAGNPELKGRIAEKIGRDAAKAFGVTAAGSRVDRNRPGV